MAGATSATADKAVGAISNGLGRGRGDFLDRYISFSFGLGLEEGCCYLQDRLLDGMAAIGAGENMGHLC